MLWCGANPVVEYGGGIALSPNHTAESMPEDVNATFFEAAAKHGIDWNNDMFYDDNTDCP